MAKRNKAWLSLIIVLVLWSTPTLFVKFFLPYYNPYAQNFLRYASATIVVLIIHSWRLHHGSKKITKKQCLHLLLPAIPNALHQTCWVVAMLWTYPAYTAFLNKSSILFAGAMAFILFPEERWLLRSARFMSGFSLTIVGTICLALCRSELRSIELNFAVGLIMLSAMMWAVYSVSVKHVASDIGSTASFTVVSLYTSIALLPPALLWGQASSWQHVPWHINVFIAASGAICIGLAHPMYYFALRILGVAVCNTILLITPIATLAFSYWLFEEHLSVTQILSGSILLLGGCLTFLARK